MTVRPLLCFQPPTDPAASDAAVPGTERHDRPSVLFVEDAFEIQTLVRHIVNDAFCLHTASSEAEATTLLTEHAFALLLLDIKLEGADSGIHLLRYARTHPESRNHTTPAVALTARAMPGDEERLLRSGFDHYIKKPFRNSDLLASLHRVLAS